MVGQDAILATLNQLRKRGLSGRTYWITGKSGTGKSTIGRLIAAEVAEQNTVEYDQPRELSAAELDRIKDSYRYCPLFGGACYIVNEAHTLRKDQIASLLGLTENAPGWVTWVFTTTDKGNELFARQDDSGPFGSRTQPLALNWDDLELSFAIRVRYVARLEGLDGRPLPDYVQLAVDCGCNMRTMFQAVEAGKMLVEGD